MRPHEPEDALHKVCPEACPKDLGDVHLSRLLPVQSNDFSLQLYAFLGIVLTSTICGGPFSFTTPLVFILTITNLLAGPGTEPLTTAYSPLTSPKWRKPPAGVIGLSLALPMARILFPVSVLWWNPICPALAMVYITAAGCHGPITPTALTVFLDLCCFLLTPILVIGPSTPFPLVIPRTSTYIPGLKTSPNFTFFPRSETA